MTGASGTRRFVYDGLDRVGDYDGASNWVADYVQGPGDDAPFLVHDGAGPRFLSSDERGSIISQSADVTGTLVSINRYDEFGQPQSTNTGAFGYTGQAWIPELKLWYYKARMYSPALGRFMQTDPIGYGSGPNLYAYVRGDPVNLSDPSGLGCDADTWVCGSSGGGAIGGYGSPGGSGSVGAEPSEGQGDFALYGPPKVCFGGCSPITVVGARIRSAISNYWNNITSSVCGAVTGPHGNGTFQLGAAGAGTVGPRALMAGAGIAVDRSGNVAGYAYGGRGFGSGLSGVFGPSLQVSNARFVSDLKGAFAVGSASLADALGGTVDVFIGQSPHGNVAGIGLTGGPGAGDSIVSGGTFTVETPSMNVFEIASGILGC